MLACRRAGLHSFTVAWVHTRMCMGAHAHVHGCIRACARVCHAWVCALSTQTCIRVYRPASVAAQGSGGGSGLQRRSGTHSTVSSGTAQWDGAGALLANTRTHTAQQACADAQGRFCSSVAFQACGRTKLGEQGGTQGLEGRAHPRLRARTRSALGCNPTRASGH